jgi:hypothetical protein
VTVCKYITEKSSRINKFLVVVGHDSEWRHGEGWSVAQPGCACSQGHDIGGAQLGKEGRAWLGQRRGVCGGAARAEAHRVESPMFGVGN